MSNSLQLRYCDATLNVSVCVNTQFLIGVSSVEVDNSDVIQEGSEASDLNRSGEASAPIVPLFPAYHTGEQKQ